MATTVGAGRVLRQGLVALALASVLVAVFADHAEARRRKHRSSGGGAGVFRVHSPIYSSIVVDAKSGKVLHAEDPDGIRHPASITKVMTLYLLFEQLEAGRLSLSTPLEVSAEAAAKPPTKLGLRPGSTITVEDAIKGVITKSANDAATVIAENLGGDEERFASAMTRKARALGMVNTVYRNASGLPDPEQVTTARDLAVLGRAIQERFPKYYRYFSTRSFAFHGRTIRGHNRVMERMDGVDGIKTGYTNASGYNLLSSVKRDGRQLVAVVMGGHTGAWRDMRMQQLLTANIEKASDGPKVAFALADTAEGRKAPLTVKASIPGPRRAPGEEPERKEVERNEKASAPMVLASAPAARPASVTGMAPPSPVSAFVAMPQPKAAVPAMPLPIAQTPPPARPGTLGTLPASSLRGDRTSAIGANVRTASASTDDDSDDVATTASPAPIKTVAASPAQVTAAKRSGEWSIQIGAFPTLSAARDTLSKAKSSGGRAMASAQDYTEEVKVGRGTLVRGRFAGFDRAGADAACKALKAHAFGCMPVRN